MSIATKHGDGGQTGLAGGIRVSKADARVESYGLVDELNSHLGFACSICENKRRSPGQALSRCWPYIENLSLDERTASGGPP